MIREIITAKWQSKSLERRDLNASTRLMRENESRAIQVEQVRRRTSSNDLLYSDLHGLGGAAGVAIAAQRAALHLCNSPPTLLQANAISELNRSLMALLPPEPN